MMRFAFKKTYAFSLNFSNLNPKITSASPRNYKISTQNLIDGYLTKNPNQQMHAVIMLHQWWGLNQSIIETAQLLANSNIKVFVPDLYRGKVAIDAEDAGHCMNGLDWPKAIEDIRMVKQHFDSNSKSVSITGFCMGGALTFACLSKIKDWKIGAPFYGIPDLNIFRLENIGCRVLANFGEQDPLKGFSDAESARSLESYAKQKKLPIEVKIWPGVSHAFCNQNGSYFHKETRDKAFAQVQKMIQE